VKEAETECFIVAPKTASQLDVLEDDILLAKNPINKKSVASKVKIDENIEDKTVLVHKTILDAIGLDEDSRIKVLKFEKEIKKPASVDFEFEIIENLDKDSLTFVKENQEEFIDFINERIWTKDSKFLWEDEKLRVSVKDTSLDIKKDEVFDFEEMEQFNYSLSSSRSGSYSSVLLIDLSGSMETKDLPRKGIERIIEKIYKNTENNRIKEYLEKLKEEPKIKRHQGATLGGLVYLLHEIERCGVNKISVILFSDEASMILFGDEKYFAPKVCDINDVFEEMIENIRYHPRGRTNISAGLNEAIEIMKDFEHDEMKMVVLLTDGEPHPASIDDRETVMDVVEDRLAPRKDVIINTIGLGDEVDHHLLDNIATETGGEYNSVNTLEGLTEAYSKYTHSISADDLYP